MEEFMLNNENPFQGDARQKNISFQAQVASNTESELMQTENARGINTTPNVNS